MLFKLVILYLLTFFWGQLTEATIRRWGSSGHRDKPKAHWYQNKNLYQVRNTKIEDINCENTCRSECSSAFKKFYFKNGEFVKMIDTNRIGQGGFGSVFKGSFHGADKLLFWDTITYNDIDMMKDAPHFTSRLPQIGQNSTWCSKILLYGLLICREWASLLPLH